MQPQLGVSVRQTGFVCFICPHSLRGLNSLKRVALMGQMGWEPPEKCGVYLATPEEPGLDAGPGSFEGWGVDGARLWSDPGGDHSLEFRRIRGCAELQL